MFSNRIVAVSKRELRERLMTKSFIISTLALPLLMTIMIGFQYLMFSMEGDAGTRLAVVSESEAITRGLRGAFSQTSWVKDGDYTLSYQTMSADEFEAYLDEHKKDILSKDLTGILFIPSSAMLDKKVVFYSRTIKNLALEEKVGWIVNQVFIDNYFMDKPVTAADIRFSRMNVRFDAFKVAKDEGIEKADFGNLLLALVFSFLLYFSLLMMGTAIMNSVLEEKTNRVCEVVLSSVTAQELMTGKIIGTTLTGLLQMVIWLSPVLVAIGLDLPVFPVEFTLSLTTWQVAYFLLNFVVGLMIFVGLFASVGAIFSTPQEASSGITPLMMLIIIPFFISMSIMRSPANPLVEVSSLVPFAAIMVMPARVMVVDVPLWQLALSFVVNIGTMLALFPMAGKIYRIGILSTGKKPTLKEFISWTRLQY